MKRLIMLIILAIFVTSCQKEEIEINTPTIEREVVITKGYVTIYPEDFISYGEVGETIGYAEIECNLITQRIVNNGSIACYVMIGDERKGILALSDFIITGYSWAFNTIHFDLKERPTQPILIEINTFAMNF
jgi:hypothetical protein